jgi:hypothetical protein
VKPALLIGAGATGQQKQPFFVISASLALRAWGKSRLIFSGFMGASLRTEYSINQKTLNGHGRV